MHPRTTTAVLLATAGLLALTACSSSSSHDKTPPTTSATVTPSSRTTYIHACTRAIEANPADPMPDVCNALTSDDYTTALQAAKTATPQTTAPPTPATPEDKINTLAEQHGWTLDDTSSDDLLNDTPLYDSPAAFVQDICDSLPDQTDGPAQWLAQDQATTADEMHILVAGIPLFCPKWTKTVKQAASGQYPVYIGSGTFKVTSRRAEDTVPPGTYRTTGDLSGCYWERSKADGTIIDNQYATAATRITVTILPSDDLFTSKDCGTWAPVH